MSHFREGKVEALHFFTPICKLIGVSSLAPKKDKKVLKMNTQDISELIFYYPKAGCGLNAYLQTIQNGIINGKLFALRHSFVFSLDLTTFTL